MFHRVLYSILSNSSILLWSFISLPLLSLRAVIFFLVCLAFSSPRKNFVVFSPSSTHFILDLWRYNEFEFVWRPLQLRQWYGEIQSQLPVFEMWPVVETCWDAVQTWTDLYRERYLIHRCAGHSMTDVIRLLENPVEATIIVQNFVLLLVEHVVWKQYQK